MTHLSQPYVSPDDDELEICPDCGEEFSPDIEDQERCGHCEAKLHEQYQNTNH